MLDGNSPWPVGPAGAFLPPDLNRFRAFLETQYGLRSVIVVMPTAQFQTAFARANGGAGPMLALSTQLDTRETIGALRVLLAELEGRAFLPPERNQ